MAAPRPSADRRGTRAAQRGDPDGEGGRAGRPAGGMPGQGGGAGVSPGPSGTDPVTGWIAGQAPAAAGAGRDAPVRPDLPSKPARKERHAVRPGRDPGDRAAAEARAPAAVREPEAPARRHSGGTHDGRRPSPSYRRGDPPPLKGCSRLNSSDAPPVPTASLLVRKGRNGPSGFNNLGPCPPRVGSSRAAPWPIYSGIFQVFFPAVTSDMRYVFAALATLAVKNPVSFRRS